MMSSLVISQINDLVVNNNFLNTIYHDDAGGYLAGRTPLLMPAGVGPGPVGGPGYLRAGGGYSGTNCTTPYLKQLMVGNTQ